jgi:methionyl-tRNA formyltransferase
MHLLIFTNRDLASNYNLNLLLPHIAHKYQIKVFLSDKVGRPDGPPPPEEQALLKFFEQTLPNNILFPELERQMRPANIGQLHTFEEMSRHYNIPFQSWNDVRSPKSLDYLRALAPDAVLSVRYGKIFPKAFLAIPKRGVINVHSGLLPNYRGVLAVFRALDHGDKQVFGTLHHIDDNTIDTGRIIGKAPLDVDPSKSLLWHILNLYPACTQMVVDGLDQLEKGLPGPVAEQSLEGAAYFTFPTPEDWARFRQKGWKTVDLMDYEAFIRQYSRQ